MTLQYVEEMWMGWFFQKFFDVRWLQRQPAERRFGSSCRRLGRRWWPSRPTGRSISAQRCQWGYCQQIPRTHEDSPRRRSHLSRDAPSTCLCSGGGKHKKDTRAIIDIINKKGMHASRHTFCHNLLQKITQVLYYPVMLGHFSPTPVKTDRAVRTQ